MNIFKYLVFLSFSFIFISCEIDETDLPDDLRDIYEDQFANSTNNDVIYLDGYTPTLTSRVSSFEYSGNQISAVVRLGGESTSFRYLFSETKLTTPQLTDQLLNQQRIIPSWGTGYTIYYTPNANTSRMYLYVVGSNYGAYGPVNFLYIDL